jgi:hypothetical protein
VSEENIGSGVALIANWQDGDVEISDSIVRRNTAGGLACSLGYKAYRINSYDNGEAGISAHEGVFIAVDCISVRNGVGFSVYGNNMVAKVVNCTVAYNKDLGVRLTQYNGGC